MLDKPFATDARHIIDAAFQVAERNQHETVEPEHVLLALLAADAAPGHTALCQLDRRPEELRALVERRVAALGKSRRPTGPLRLAPGLRRLIELAAMEASSRCQDAIDSGHLLLALTHPRQGGVTSVLVARGVTYERVRTQLAEAAPEPQRIAEPVVAPEPYVLVKPAG
jgi:ATP-dependent Clp protease ATP-binding subunit ClpB